jgi:hypothetical protein
MTPRDKPAPVLQLSLSPGSEAFAGCGNCPIAALFWEGHDFSLAVRDAQINAALAAERVRCRTTLFRTLLG